MFLGILVAVLGFVALFMWIDANNAKDAAKRAAAKVAGAASAPVAGHDVHAHATAAESRELRRCSPTNADGARCRTRALPGSCRPPRPVRSPTCTSSSRTSRSTIAPGVKYSAWAFAGGAPGPVIHVRQGQTVKMTLTNDGAIPHSVDFHAARIAPNVAFDDVVPGKSFSYTFVANDPGVFMYHCGTKPVLMHIANGMYGAIVVEPATGLAARRQQYVLVASEWYLSSTASKAPPVRHGRRRTHDARLGDLQRLRGPVRQAPADREPGETRAVLGRRCRPVASTPTSTSSAPS